MASVEMVTSVRREKTRIPVAALEVAPPQTEFTAVLALTKDGFLDDAAVTSLSYIPTPKGTEVFLTTGGTVFELDEKDQKLLGCESKTKTSGGPDYVYTSSSDGKYKFVYGDGANTKCDRKTATWFCPGPSSMTLDSTTAVVADKKPTTSISKGKTDYTYDGEGTMTGMAMNMNATTIVGGKDFNISMSIDAQYVWTGNEKLVVEQELTVMNRKTKSKATMEYEYLEGKNACKSEQLLCYLKSITTTYNAGSGDVGPIKVGVDDAGSLVDADRDGVLFSYKTLDHGMLYRLMRAQNSEQLVEAVPDAGLRNELLKTYRRAEGILGDIPVPGLFHALSSLNTRSFRTEANNINEEPVYV